MTQSAAFGVGMGYDTSPQVGCRAPDDDHSCLGVVAVPSIRLALSVLQYDLH